MASEPIWTEGVQQFFTEHWSKALQTFGQLGTVAPAADAAQVQFDVEKLQALQQSYIAQASQLWSGGLSQAPQVPKDRRFASENWAQNPLAAFTAAAYSLNSHALMGMAEAVQADEKTRQRIRFAVEQWVAAMAPSNFLALNPDAQKKALETKGESLSKGLQNMLQDMGKGYVSMTDESVFEVGKNVATTEGAVVYENDIFQLLEYKPLTEKVHERPFLLVPPCINKFYILDLQPDNSLIRYAVSQGHRTFVISWRNPDASCAHLTWDDYIERAVIEAIGVVQEIAGAAQINALGFCVGGTMLATALAVLAARGQKPVASATLLTTLFLLFILPMWDMALPYTPVLITLTFVAGLVPIVGNLLCNAVITLVGLSVSPVAAVACLAFLILIHKAEYVINAKVVGRRTHMGVWELLSVMFVAEAVFGAAGLVAAPLFYAYLKKELFAARLV